MKNFFNVFLIFNFLCFSYSLIDLREYNGFKCYGSTKLSIPLRVTLHNKIECFSTNGMNCISNLNSEIKCKEFITQNISSLKPITCSQSNIRDGKHWCSKAYQFFFSKWQCGDKTGLDIAFKLDPNSGNVMCLSFNGKTCLEGKFAQKICRKANHCIKTLERIKPVFCGSDYYKMYNHFGYNFPSFHWCKRSYAYFKYNGVLYKERHTGINALLKLTDIGDIECISENGKECLKNIIPSEEKEIKEDYDGYQKIVIKCELNKTTEFCMKSFNFFFNKIFKIINIHNAKEKGRNVRMENRIRPNIIQKINNIFENNSINQSQNQSLYNNNRDFLRFNLEEENESIYRLEFGSRKWKDYMKNKYGQNYKENYRNRLGINWKSVLKNWWIKKNRLAESIYSNPFGSKNWKLFMEHTFGMNWRNFFLIKIGNNWRNHLKYWWEKKRNALNRK